VDAYASDCNYVFGALFMPTAVINLFSGMIFKPVLTTLTACYERHQYKDFLRLLGILMGVVAGLTVICMAGAWLLGVPVLSAIYAVDLAPYKAELLILLVGGGFNAAGILAYYALVVMRRQKYILGCYGITFAFTCVLPFMLVKNMKIRGAAIAFVLVMLVQLAVFLALLLLLCRKEAKEYENC
jgi:O-antigen/teichoic acid export membrane protein